MAKNFERARAIDTDGGIVIVSPPMELETIRSIQTPPTALATQHHDPPRPRRSAWQHLGGHVRDALIQMFPLEMRTDRGLIVRLRNRSELSVYRNIFVQRVYPLDACAAAIADVERPVFFDVGANSGLFAALVLDRWPQARVYSFEPQKELSVRITEFAAINGLKNQLDVVWAAVGKESGTGEFYQNRSPISASLLKEKAARRTIRRVSRVPITTLDDFVAARKIERVDVLKLDVEGVEIDVMESASKVLRSIKFMFLEVHPPFGTFSGAARVLKDYGLVCISPVPLPGDEEQANCVFARKP